MAETFHSHIVENITGDGRSCILIKTSDEIHIFLMYDLAEELFFLVPGICILHKMIQRRRYDQLIKFLCPLACRIPDSNLDLTVRSFRRTYHFHHLGI